MSGDDGSEYASKRKAVVVRVLSLSDLVKIAAIGAARMAVLPIYRYAGKGKTVFFIQTVFKDYYKLYGLPLIYYYTASGENRQGKYVLVRVDEEGEKMEISDRSRPGWVTIPIIDLAELPPFMPEEVLS